MSQLFVLKCQPKSELIVIIHAPFLIKGVKALLQQDKIEVCPFFAHKQYLKRNYLKVELWTKDLSGEELLAGSQFLFPFLETVKIDWKMKELE